MKQLDELLEMWRKDCDIDRTEPGKALLDIPKLHSKYLTILSKHRMLGKEAEFQLNRWKKTKWEYYTGKMSQEQLKELGWEPFDLKILRQDVDIYLDSDSELLELKNKISIQEEKVDYLNSILKGITNRQFHIRDAIAWRKFLSGSM